jgi:excisionase family DNA binding protein
LTPRQLAARLGWNRWSVYEAIKAGTIPARRFTPRGRLLIDEAEVKEALKPCLEMRRIEAIIRRAQEPTSPAA